MQSITPEKLVEFYKEYELLEPQPEWCVYLAARINEFTFVSKPGTGHSYHLGVEVFMNGEYVFSLRMPDRYHSRVIEELIKSGELP